MQTMEIQATPAPVAIGPARTVILVIAMQNAFGAPGGMFDRAGIRISGIQAAVAPTRAALGAARRAGRNIVYVKMGFKPDLSDLGAEDVPNGQLFVHLGVKDGVLARDTWGTDILDMLAPGDEDTVLYKTRFSGFYRTGLDELLTAAGITHLIMTGCTTSICVESTIRDAFFRDDHCVVLEDCTADPIGARLSRSNYQATLRRRRAHLRGGRDLHRLHRRPLLRPSTRAQHVVSQALVRRPAPQASGEAKPAEQAGDGGGIAGTAPCPVRRERPAADDGPDELPAAAGCHGGRARCG